jgi:hypothetical protein
VNVVDSSVYRHLLRHVGREDALSVVAAMRQGTVADLDDRLALAAAELSVATRLAMTDSVMLATARAHGALLWTQDADFEGLEDVRLTRQALIPAALGVAIREAQRRRVSRSRDRLDVADADELLVVVASASTGRACR